MTRRPRLPASLPKSRVCAVCGQRESPSGRKGTFGYKIILAKHGISGAQAHPECVAGLGPKSPPPALPSSD